MNSLVERLRAKDDPTCNAAAHEIEQLRDSLARFGQRIESARREAKLEEEMNHVYRNDLSDARETIALLETRESLLKSDLSSMEELALALRNCFDPYGDGRLIADQSSCKEACERFDDRGQDD
jgi:chromosome segregation ATPase